MQKYLLDENLSRKLIDRLAPAFVNISHVANEGLLNSLDGSIWEFAKNNKLIIITKDYDFSDMSHLYGCPRKVIKLNCGNRATEYIGNLLLAHYESIRAFALSDNCYMEML